jgi:alkylation response protein AidB-like acyl-CoA dehydrogenase
MENILSASCRQTIQQFAAKAEQLGTLTDELLTVAYTNNWFKLFVPQVYGGPGLLLPEILRLEESIAAEDGSLGWTVTLCSGAGWFAGFLDPELATEVFSDPKVCFAGSGAVGGTAVETADGYVINGTWKYASGATHATIFTANCVLTDSDGKKLKDDQGEPKVKSFILKKKEVEILPGWSYFGLVATGSHAFTVNNIQVPSNRTFEINAGIQVQSTGFDYPFLQLAETTLAVNSAGMAAHFIRLTDTAFAERSGQKRYTAAQVLYFERELKHCIAELQEARTAFYAAFDESWRQLMQYSLISDEQLRLVSTTSRKLAHTSRRTADQLFPYAGLEAAKKETEINRVWRDLHTASQHSLLTFES